ncbi:tRNA dimethylallyltransferase [Cohnella abietis]|uniref:tRNA dimethylallyltransferase n=1 Tax=Cohnella abietis TaxID=2507935 RepID=A0A3T1D6D9_9BACL|nr:tRNA dimethylallyltransferase [Cohnella abietis]
MNSETDDRPLLLVLVGPTAVGKTALSLQLAKALNAEIISGDSMQVYRRMDIGTAKLMPEDREGIPHHLIDICEPDHPFSVSEFQSLCTQKIQDIHSRGRLPFIVGGTGLYVESVCYGFQFQNIGVNEAYREQMRAFALTNGPEALHERLAVIDPLTAAKLHYNDEGRVIRALEVFHMTGKPLSEQQDQSRGDDKKSPYRLCIIGLTMDRAELYHRIEQRIDDMMAAGLVEEVSVLLKEGIPREAVSMRGLGYKEIVAYLAGEMDYDAAVEILKRDTRHFAKRQLSWFRHMKALEWVHIEKEEKMSELFQEICAIIAGKFLIDIEYIYS